MTQDPKKAQLPDTMALDGSVYNGDMEEVQLNKDFNLWSTLGVAFSYIATPLSIGSYLAFSLSAGGSPYFFYGYVTAFVLNTLVALSLAEMAGFLPHTSGQIFWTSQLAPPQYSRAMSYVTGAFTILGWIFWTSGTWLFTTQIFTAFIQLCGASWVVKDYHTFLIYLAFGTYSLIFNTLGFKMVPFLSKCLLVGTNAGAIFVLIALLARTSPKPSAREVFVDVVNETGWSSEGLVFLISLLPGVTALTGFDSAAHLAEEVPQPKKMIPQVMVGTVLLCGLSGLPMVIGFLFSISNPENLLLSTQPILQLLKDSLRSKGLSITTGLIYCLLYIYAAGSILTTSSRVWWSFARSGALPFSAWQGHVNEKWTLPINAILVAVAVNIVIGFFIFGPATVLTGLVGSAAVCFYISYSIPIACLMIRGRQGLPVKRYWNLGRMGSVINAVSVAWMILASVFLCFPTYYPVTVSLMNYCSAVIGIAVTLWVIIWFTYARHHYKAPTPMEADVLDAVTSATREPSHSGHEAEIKSG